jgi:hypothetical protein
MRLLNTLGHLKNCLDVCDISQDARFGCAICTPLVKSLVGFDMAQNLGTTFFISLRNSAKAAAGINNVVQPIHFSNWSGKCLCLGPHSYPPLTITVLKDPIKDGVTFIAPLEDAIGQKLLFVHLCLTQMFPWLIDHRRHDH